jgi:hypothetical protein
VSGGAKRGGLAVMASVVTIQHEGKSYEVEVDGHDSILEAGLCTRVE